MLEEVLRYVNNRFEVGRRSGAFSVSGGQLEIAGLQDGQYFWVEGSVFNDGLHRHPDADMHDEDFEGTVALLAVPPALLDLADEIGEWVAANSAVLNSPFQSESFGGYSYSKATGTSEGSETPAAAWQLQFGARLHPYRKLGRDWA